MNINLTLLMQAVAFFAFILFTAKFVWPPLMRAIDTRQKQIADGLAAGEEGRHNLINAEKRVAEMMSNAKARASDIVAQGEKLKSEAVDRGRIAAKESLLLSLCGGDLSAEGKSFIRVLLESDRISVLPDIRALFDTLKDSADNVARAQIVSAFPVDDAQLGALKAALEKRFGKTI